MKHYSTLREMFGMRGIIRYLISLEEDAAQKSDRKLYGQDGISRRLLMLRLAKRGYKAGALFRLRELLWRIKLLKSRESERVSKWAKRSYAKRKRLVDMCIERNYIEVVDDGMRGLRIEGPDEQIRVTTRGWEFVQPLRFLNAVAEEYGALRSGFVSFGGGAAFVYLWKSAAGWVSENWDTILTVLR